MNTSQKKQPHNNKKLNDENSLKNAMYTSILFVGGGIALFWLVLFIFYTIRG